MRKISYACCLGLCPAISSHFTLAECAAAKNAKNLSKTLFWEFKVVDVDKTERPVTSACCL